MQIQTIKISFRADKTKSFLTFYYHYKIGYSPKELFCVMFHYQEIPITLVITISLLFSLQILMHIYIIKNNVYIIYIYTAKRQLVSGSPRSKRHGRDLTFSIR